MRVSSGNLPQVRESKKEFATSVWEYLRENVGTTVRNRGLLLYYWCMAMMDNAMLESYDSFDFFPQSSVKVEMFEPEDFKMGCSNLTRDAETWKPAITARNAHPKPRQVMRMSPWQVLCCAHDVNLLHGVRIIFPLSDFCGAFKLHSRECCEHHVA